MAAASAGQGDAETHGMRLIGEARFVDELSGDDDVEGVAAPLPAMMMYRSCLRQIVELTAMRALNDCISG